jgi:hypothetical protein
VNRAVGAAALLLVACGPDPASPPFPRDYETAWTETRPPCRFNHDHELRYIRTFGDALAAEPHIRIGDLGFPEGATLLKVEYADDRCTELLSYVTMTKLAPGTGRATAGWRWQRWTPSRREVDDPRRIPDTCVNCHTYHCERPPFGFDYACAPGMEPEPLDGGVGDGG